MENSKEGGRSLAQRAALVSGMTFLVLVVGAGAASATTPVDPGTIAGDLANQSGGAVLSAIMDVLPALIPILVAFWAVGFVWKKVRPKGGGVG